MVEISGRTEPGRGADHQRRVGGGYTPDGTFKYFTQSWGAAAIRLPLRTESPGRHSHQAWWKYVVP